MISYNSSCSTLKKKKVKLGFPKNSDGKFHQWSLILKKQWPWSKGFKTKGEVKCLEKPYHFRN